MTCNYGVVLIDYRSGDRTYKYIEDFVRVVDVLPKVIVIVDNDINSENSFNFLKKRLNCEDKSTIEENICCKCCLNGSYEGIKIILIKSKDNLGYAKANNLGAKVIRKFSVNDILFSNSDIVFDQPVLKISLFISKLKSDNNILAVGSDVFSIDRVTRQSPCRYMSIEERYWKNYFLWPFNRLFVRSKSDTINVNSEQEVYRLVGAFFMANIDRFFACGGFDEKTFLYAEESILSERALKKGYITYYVPNVPVIHEDGLTTDDKKGKFNPKRLKQRMNSDMYYYKTYKNVPELIIFFTKVIVNIYIYKRKFVYKIIKR